jgi:hypothetical protein
VLPEIKRDFCLFSSLLSSSRELNEKFPFFLLPGLGLSINYYWKRSQAKNKLDDFNLWFFSCSKPPNYPVVLSGVFSWVIPDLSFP